MKASKTKNLLVELNFKTAQYSVNRKELVAFIEAVLKLMKINNAQISFCFVTNEYMKKLNFRYKKHLAYTDVLSFPLFEDTYTDEGSLMTLLGEVVISLDQTKRNARLYNTTFIDELYVYVIHGILHILGYEDSTKEKRDTMFRLQEKLYKKIMKK
jgi:probable rRNA maturation factor